jgi:hypothetical protein
MQITGQSSEARKNCSLKLGFLVLFNGREGPRSGKNLLPDRARKVSIYVK